MKNKENDIPIIDGEFRPAMAEISLMMDALLQRAESGDQDAEELYNKAEKSLFNLVEILEISQHWEEFKKTRGKSEQVEVLKTLLESEEPPKDNQLNP